jgi:hypothetical protein
MSATDTFVRQAYNCPPGLHHNHLQPRVPASCSPYKSPLIFQMSSANKSSRTIKTAGSPNNKSKRSIPMNIRIEPTALLIAFACIQTLPALPRSKRDHPSMTRSARQQPSKNRTSSNHLHKRAFQIPLPRTTSHKTSREQRGPGAVHRSQSDRRLVC